MKRQPKNTRTKSKAKKSTKTTRGAPPRTRKAGPRTDAQYHAQTERFKDRWNKVVNVVSKMRDQKLSLRKASQESGISPQTVKRWASSALQKRASGKWTAKRTDNLLRILVVPASDGKREVAVRGSRQASTLGSYWAAVQNFLATGDRSRLAQFRGQFIKAANGEKIPLLTDRAELKRLGYAGALSFEALYGRQN